MKIERIVCDCCGEHVNNATAHWESRATHVTIHCPPDGINGGQWSMDVCAKCRKLLHETIRDTVDGIREHSRRENELQAGVRSRADGWG